MGRFIALMVVCTCLYFGWKRFDLTVPAVDGRNAGTEELARLAATVKPDEVVMYSTTECGYCAQAKSWLDQYGFAFKECNMSISPECVREFKSYGADGTPYLIVRGHHMKDGFDSDVFISLLKRS
jgi:glutaredoxin